MAAALTGTAVDLAGRVGAMVLWTLGSSPAGTVAVAPYLHESADASTWGTATDVTSTRHGSLVGTQTATAQGSAP
jgi:hypothetical protein